jgi:glucose dehydrogenase
MVTVSGGFASPVYSDGLVYLSYYVPSGVRDEGLFQRIAHPTKWLIEGDDVVIALSAETGKTMWKKTFPGRGLNYQRFNKGGPSLTPYVAAGRVYAVGSGFHLYALDAKTGDLVWEGKVPDRFEAQQKVRETTVAMKTMLAFNRDALSALVVADGVLVMNNHSDFSLASPPPPWTSSLPRVPRALVAFDAATGKVLWKSKFLPSGGPRVYVHEGKEYLLAAASQDLGAGRPGRLVLMNPRTGDELWSHETGRNRHVLVSGGDYVLSMENAPMEADAIGGFKISPQGAKKLWTLDPKYGRYENAAIMHGHAFIQPKPKTTGGPGLLVVELETGKIVKELPGPKVDVHGFVVAANGRVLVTGESDTTISYYGFEGVEVGALRDLGTAPFKRAVGYESPLAPVIVGGRMFLRTPTAIVAYDLRAP